jgi:hypothetical protein
MIRPENERYRSAIIIFKTNKECCQPVKLGIEHLMIFTAGKYGCYNLF